MRRRRLEHLLPGIFQRTLRENSPISALLDVMEALQEPSEAVLRYLELYFDPRRTPDPFVPYLAHWVDLGVLFQHTVLGHRSPAVPISTGLGRLRELVAGAALLSKWRGTKKGLVMFMELATGAGGFQVEENIADEHGSPIPFRLRVIAPAEVENHRPLLERIIELEKPAYSTFELEFRRA